MPDIESNLTHRFTFDNTTADSISSANFNFGIGGSQSTQFIENTPIHQGIEISSINSSDGISTFDPGANGNIGLLNMSVGFHLKVAGLGLAGVNVPILSKTTTSGTGNELGFSFYTIADRLFFTASDGTGAQITVNGPISANIFSHWGVRFDQGLNAVFLYKDGVIVAATGIPPTFLPINSTSPMVLSGGGTGLSRTIDDLRFYDRGLLHSEFTRLAEYRELEPGLIHHWRFNNELRDSRGSSNFSGTVSYLDDYAGKSARLTSGTVSTPNVSTLQLNNNNSFTFSGWIRLATLPVANIVQIFRKKASNTATSPGYGIRLAPGGGILFQISDGTNQVQISGTFPGVPGQLHHVAALLNRDTDDMAIFVDGNRVATANPVAVAAIASGNNTQPTQFNNSVGDTMEVNDYRFYNVPLTDAKIARIANKDSLDVDLLHHWRFNRSLYDEKELADFTLANGTLAYESGVIGDHARLSNSARLEATDRQSLEMIANESYTISAWLTLRSATPVGFLNILRKKSDGQAVNRGYIFQITSAQRLKFLMSDGVDQAEREFPLTLVQGVPTHVAVRVNTATSIIRLFVNGAQVNHSGNGVSLGAVVGTSNTLPAMVRLDNAAQDVGIDDLRFYDRMLNNAEIARLGAETGDTANGLIHYYPLESNLNDTIAGDNFINTSGTAEVYTQLSAMFPPSAFAQIATPPADMQWRNFDSFTIMFFMRLTSHVSQSFILRNKIGTGSGNPGWTIFVDPPNGVISTALSDGSVVATSQIDSQPPAAGAWIHVAVVVNRLTQTQKIYIDGVDQPEVLGGVGLDQVGAPHAVSQPVNLANGAANVFIDEIRVFNRAVASDEILFLSNAIDRPSSGIGMVQGIIGNGVF